MFGLSLRIFSPNSTLLCWYNLLVVRIRQVVVPSNWARKDVTHEVHLFGYTSRLLFFFPEFNFVAYGLRAPHRLCGLVLRRTPGRPPLHPSSLLTEVSTLPTGPSASRNTFSVSTITDGFARTINPYVRLTVHRAVSVRRSTSGRWPSR